MQDETTPQDHEEFPKTFSFQNPTFRRYLYRIAMAIFAVLVVYGVVGPDETSAWLLLAAGVLGLGGSGLADRNVR